MTESNFALAIIGLGPRGHYALESFLANLSELYSGQALKIILFEESKQIGNGPVWDKTQPDSNWSNINERSLILPERQDIQLGTMLISGFPSYHIWANLRFADNFGNHHDIYPPRRRVGQYLSERFQSMLEPLLRSGIATMIPERVDNLSTCGHNISITSQSGKTFIAEQALLTVGHQPTRQDVQITDWIAATKNAPKLQLFIGPYPVEPIISGVSELTDINMAVRGFGLATIDIARATALEFGSFTITDERTRAQTYKLDNDVNLNIIPFSLDGLPMGPKPLNEKLDKQFMPPQKVLDELNRQLCDREKQRSAQTEAFLLDALVPIIATTYRTLANGRANAPSDSNVMARLILGWINDPAYDHSCILSTNNTPVEVLEELVGMGTGEVPISLDYCIGQVWRHCHPTIYSALSHSDLSDEVLAKIIFIDESIKRYSFGPPTESLQQLLALYHAGVLNLDYLKDPDIKVSEGGWILSNRSEQMLAHVMVDAVLDSPKIEEVRSALVEGLLNEGTMVPVHDDLGVATSGDGFIVANSEDPPSLAIVGRLVKGTVIGVDAILECFGTRPQNWAISAVNRLSTAERSNT